MECQEKLFNRINSLDSLPHSIFLLGDIGAGHEEVCKYISKKFNLQLVDISENITNDIIFEILSNLTPTLYCINMNNIGIREQNIILKLYEEPSKYSHIVLNATFNDFILDTIKSRSYILKFDNYSSDYLKTLVYPTFTDLEMKVILNICTTPGLIEIANHTNITELFNLCCKIITNMKGSNFQNALSIANKINYSDLYDKYDLNLFIKMLKYVILNSDIESKLDIYKIVSSGLDRINNITNKQQLLEKTLIDLWQYCNKLN